MGKIENGDLDITETELDVAFQLYGVSGRKVDEVRQYCGSPSRAIA